MIGGPSAGPGGTGDEEVTIALERQHLDGPRVEVGQPETGQPVARLAAARRRSLAAANREGGVADA